MDNTDTTGICQTNSSTPNDFWEFIDILGFFPSLRCIAELEETKRSNGHPPTKIQEHEGPPELRYKIAKGWNKKGYGIFWLGVYCGNSYEETARNIQFFRTLTLDLDGAPIEPVIAFLPPTVVVETSPHKYHATWVFNKPVSIKDVSVEEFDAFYTKLSTHFKADVGAGKATQVMRCPGFLHFKKEPYESRIYYRGKQGDKRAYYSYAELREAGNKIFRNNKPDLSRRSGNGERLPTSPDGLLLLTSEPDDGISEEAKVNLNDVLGGKVRVVHPNRHATIFSLFIKLLEEGKSYDEVQNTVLKCIKNSFEEPNLFLPGGQRHESDFVKSFKDAAADVGRNQMERKLQMAAALEPIQEEAAKSPFNYDFSQGILRTSPYSEMGIVERVIQKFDKDLALVDAVLYCFKPDKMLWRKQKLECAPDVIPLVNSCIHDVLAEDGFKNKKFKDAKGNAISEVKRDKIIEGMFKVNYVNSLTSGVLKSHKIKEYTFNDFDSDPELFFCDNGVLNLASGELRDAKNEDKLLNKSPIAWDCAAECPRWLEFVSQIFAENHEPLKMQSFLQRVFGYSLSGFTTQQRIFCHQGDGANGKSKTLSALAHIMGEYFTIIEPNSLLTTKNQYQEQLERVGAKIEGKRFVLIDDFEVQSVWNESFVKLLTGTTVRARGLYEKTRTVPIRAKFHIGLNLMPKTEAENLGIIRRLCPILYPRRFDSNEKSDEIDQMIREEAPGILVWAVEGYQKYKASGMDYPDETKLALIEYKESNFSLESAIQTLFEKVPEGHPEGSWEIGIQITEDINRYFQANGRMEKVSSEQVGHALKRCGYTIKDKKKSSIVNNTVIHYFLKLRFKRENRDAVNVLR